MQGPALRTGEIQGLGNSSPIGFTVSGFGFRVQGLGESPPSGGELMRKTKRRREAEAVARLGDRATRTPCRRHASSNSA